MTPLGRMVRMRCAPFGHLGPIGQNPQDFQGFCAMEIQGHGLSYTTAPDLSCSRPFAVVTCPIPKQTAMTEAEKSEFRIRKLIGLLGVSLPFALPLLGGGEVIASMSHYYYLTAPSLFFIITLSALGLFLISYRGNRRFNHGSREVINDDWFTNIAGAAILLVVLLQGEALQVLVHISSFSQLNYSSVPHKSSSQ